MNNFYYFFVEMLTFLCKFILLSQYNFDQHYCNAAGWFTNTKVD